MRYLILQLLLMHLLVGCHDGDEPDSGTARGTALLEARLDSLFATEIAPDEPGAALMVAYDGRLLIGKGYGLRDLEAGEPITVNTQMRMASVSKQFTALAVLSLVDAGRLSLSDTVYRIFPFEVFRGVTIEQLLNHTSGIPDGEEAFFEIWDSTRIATNRDLVEWYRTNPPAESPPGEVFRYNNGAYELLAAIVEEVSGQDFAAYAREQVFRPAGMEHTVFYNTAAPIELPERARAYDRDSTGQWKPVDGHYLNGLLGAGGVYTSVADYFAYDRALREQRILSPGLHRKIFQPSSMQLEEHPHVPFEYPGDKYYAMGWEVTDRLAVHGGGWFGTQTFVIHALDRPLTIAIFMNSERLFDTDLIEESYRVVTDFLEGSAG